MNLPRSVQVFQRDWLSSNNILFVGDTDTAIVDTGYASHAKQTLALVQHALGERPLNRIINTHLHSDHCGGNALLQSTYPDAQTFISESEAPAVKNWDVDALSYAATGQDCPRFRFEHTLKAEQTISLADMVWQVHAAPGHDPHSLLLFEPISKTLISADALWEKGFGVVFPELDGEPGFADVAKTLDVIEALSPNIVIPGHGAIFYDVATSLDFARQRIQAFIDNPLSHARHAVKVLLKFKMLELQSCSRENFFAWCAQTPYLHTLHQNYFSELGFDAWLEEQLLSLEKSKAITLTPTHIYNL